MMAMSRISLMIASRAGAEVGSRRLVREMRTETRRKCLLRHDVREQTDPTDLHLDMVSGSQELGRIAEQAYAAGRAGYDHIAWMQDRERRDVADQFLDRENEVLDRGVLPEIAVNSSPQFGSTDIFDLVLRDEARAECSRANEVLARDELRRVALPVPGAEIVIASEARDMFHRSTRRDGVRSLADHDCELPFIVELLRDRGFKGLATVPDLRVGKAREQHWMRRCRTGRLVPMTAIVHARAHDLLRIGYRRQKEDVRDRKVGRSSRHGFGQFGQRSGRQNL